MGGKADAAYYRRWRASHPEYKVRQNALRNKRRKEKGRGDRTREYERRRLARLRQNADNGFLAESSLVRKAKELATAKRCPDRRTLYWDDTHEELVGICILALCEGADPEEAMRKFLKREWQHRYYRIGDVNDALI